MSLIDNLLATITPYDCLGCKREGSLLCPACAQNLPAVLGHCYRCYELTPGEISCQSCLLKTELHSLRAAVSYAAIAKDLIWKLKSAGAQAAAKQMAALLVSLVPEGSDALIVHVPTATTRVRQRGYDQAKLLARELAKQARLPYANVLARSGQAHQVGASRAHRHAQISDAFRVSRPRQVRGAHIILVDDVLTTGATLEAAAATLRAAGASKIDALAFAQAY